MKAARMFSVGLALMAAAACTADALSPAGPPADDHAHLSVSTANATATQYLARANARLGAAGATYAVAKLEYLTIETRDAVSNREVFANDRELRLPFRWVPADPRRDADGNNLTYQNYAPLMFATGASGLLNAEPSIDSSFATWNSSRCSSLNLVKRPFTGVFPSALFAGGDPFVADIVTLGFLPGAFFDLVLGPGASSFVLGVTFTFIFLEFDDEGSLVPSDIDRDGRLDTALKEIWYNDNFNWSTSGSGGIDIETVALHENGHALEMGHFGRLTFHEKQGRIQASPRAVMNAAYLGLVRSPLGTDNASYCSNFGSWPS